MEIGEETENALLTKRSGRRAKKRNIVRVGTWNVRSMLIAGRLEETAREMRRYNVGILALQETRWRGTGRIDREHYTVYYSGEEKQGKNGTAFMIDKRYRGRVKKFKPINGRLCSITITNKQANITIVNAYAPTEDAEEGKKSEFYEKIEEIYGDIPKNDIVLIMGDFNAKVGREDHNAGIAGKETIHAETNDNGSRLCNLAFTTDTIISSTKFRHRMEHKITWLWPGKKEGNQIDHILISKKWDRIIHDVRSFRGANVDTDHILLIAKMKLKIIKGTNPRSNVKKWNIDKLREDTVSREFAHTLGQKLAEHEEVRIEEDWGNIREDIIQTADTVLGHRQATERNEWFDAECECAVKEKNSARNTWLSAGKDKELQDYRKKRSRSTKLMRRKKTEWLNNFMTELERNNKDGRKLFQYVRRQGSTKRITPEIEKQKWESHFKKLYATERSQEYLGNHQTVESPSIQEDPPTPEELKYIIKGLKTNKAAGPDGVVNELIRNGGDQLQKRIHNLIVKIWKEEKMPTDWKEGLLLPIHKKGDPTKCENYRGIMLLNTAYKILTAIIRKRLEKYTEEILGDYQQGFRPGRSTMDAVHTITQVIEKAYEHNIELHILFIDFKQAFDSINRCKLLEEMENMNVPPKLIRLAKMTMDGSIARALTREGTTEEINIQRGVRQGDALSTTLFNIALDGTVKATGMYETIIRSSWQLIAYADDIALIAKNKRSLEKGLLMLEREAGKRGLEINEEKTKYMASTRKSKDNDYIKIGPYTFKQVETFRYLGVTISGKADRSTEISERVKAGNRTYWRYRRLLIDRNIGLKTKLRIYKTAIRPVATYGAEVMCLTDKDQEKLRVFERKVLRKILGPKKTEEGQYRALMNFEIEQALEGEDIVKTCKQQRLRWFGHVQRRSHDASIRRVLEWRPMEDRLRGRPRMRWEDQVLKDISALNVKNWRKQVKDREAWRELIARVR